LFFESIKCVEDRSYVEIDTCNWLVHWFVDIPNNQNLFPDQFSKNHNFYWLFKSEWHCQTFHWIEVDGHSGGMRKTSQVVKIVTLVDIFWSLHMAAGKILTCGMARCENPTAFYSYLSWHTWKVSATVPPWKWRTLQKGSGLIDFSLSREFLDFHYNLWEKCWYTSHQHQLFRSSCFVSPSKFQLSIPLSSRCYFFNESTFSDAR